MSRSEPDDWNALVEQHSERVFRTALRVLGSVQDAEDVSQEVFIEAHRKRQEIRIENWVGFLVRVTTLRSIDRLRQRRPVVAVRESDKVSHSEPHEQASANELAVWMRRCLLQLSDRLASVFVMTHFEKLSRDEIANSLAISPAAVSSALYKARQELLEHLNIYQQGEAK